jgi:hypothetical protein
MDVERLEQEMRLLAEERVTRFAGAEEILLTKSAAARICNKSIPWIDNMIATGRLPTTKVGPKDWIQRPVLIEALVRGM